MDRHEFDLHLVYYRSCFHAVTYEAGTEDDIVNFVTLICGRGTEIDLSLIGSKRMTHNTADQLL